MTGDRPKYPNDLAAERRAIVAGTVAVVVGLLPFAFAVADGRWPYLVVAAAPVVFGALFAWGNGVRARRSHKRPGTARYTGFAAGLWVGVVLLVLATTTFWGLALLA